MSKYNYCLGIQFYKTDDDGNELLNSAWKCKTISRKKRARCFICWKDTDKNLEEIKEKE